MWNPWQNASKQTGDFLAQWIRNRKLFSGAALAGWGVLLLFLLSLTAFAQYLSKRLILKDGTYQLATQWEIKGDRVRYLSAERNEWEEMPKSLVDWDATEKYQKNREAGEATPEAAELDKDLQAERSADEAKSPHVAPGLRLSDDGSVALLDTFQGEPQLVELQQTGGDINRNMKGNILRGVINPIASAKQAIEIPGQHAKVQAHSTVPAVYINVAQQDQPSGDAAQSAQKPEQPMQPAQPWDRFRIVRAESKQDKRIVGNIKIAVYGKVSQEQKLVPTTAQKLTGGWVKVTPDKPLAPGEYALVELLGADGVNLYVWDFGVNPNAPANALVTKPEPSAATPEAPKELQKRQ